MVLFSVVSVCGCVSVNMVTLYHLRDILMKFLLEQGMAKNLYEFENSDALQCTGGDLMSPLF